MKNTYLIQPDHLSLDQLQSIFRNASRVRIGSDSRQRIHDCRNFLEKSIRQAKRPYYGINTGFGSLCNERIGPESLEELQANLVRSHACGAGEETPEEIVKMILFFKARSLCYGYSGVRIELVERLLDHFNENVLPVLYDFGSLGASGDLAPLAHLSLPLIGEGQVRIDGVAFPAAAVLEKMGWKPLHLKAKEGLALLNGTQFSLAYAAWSVLQGRQLLAAANLCAAFSMEAFQCDLQPLDPKLQEIRPHAGQAWAARKISELLSGGDLSGRKRYSVQDPYSFRCTPVVHGASYTALDHAGAVAETEVNSVTDNPNLFAREKEIISGGNFHAQPLALVMDYLAIALAEAGSISERRTYQLISGQRDLPAYLTRQAGLESGMMISQYTAASIVSRNKQLCSPASVDSIVTSMGQEDHVSMAANAGTKLYQVVQNLFSVLSIEFMVAQQALGFREARLSEGMSAIRKEYRRIVPPLEHDRSLSEDIRKTEGFLRSLDLPVSPAAS